MLEVLQFIMAGFWTFVGTIILVGSIGWAVARIVLAFRGIVVLDTNKRAEAPAPRRPKVAN
jgi:hypothetical protein